MYSVICTNPSIYPMPLQLEFEKALQTFSEADVQRCVLEEGQGVNQRFSGVCGREKKYADTVFFLLVTSFLRRTLCVLYLSYAPITKLFQCQHTMGRRSHSLSRTHAPIQHFPPAQTPSAVLW